MHAEAGGLKGEASAEGATNAAVERGGEGRTQGGKEGRVIIRRGRGGHVSGGSAEQAAGGKEGRATGRRYSASKDEAAQPRGVLRVWVGSRAGKRARVVMRVPGAHVAASGGDGAGLGALVLHRRVVALVVAVGAGAPARRTAGQRRAVGGGGVPPLPVLPGCAASRRRCRGEQRSRPHAHGPPASPPAGAAGAQGGHDVEKFWGSQDHEAGNAGDSPHPRPALVQDEDDRGDDLRGREGEREAGRAGVSLASAAAGGS